MCLFPNDLHDHNARFASNVPLKNPNFCFFPIFSLCHKIICNLTNTFLKLFRSSRSEVFLVKGVLKICSKFTGEHPCQSVVSIKLLRNFIEITLPHGCSPVNLLHIFRTPFTKNTSGWLLLTIFSLIVLV